MKPDTATTAESKDTSEGTVHTSGPTVKTRKMTKHHHGRVSVKERMLKNSRGWKRMTRKESGAGLRGAESPDGDGELTRNRQSTILQRKTKTNRCRGDGFTWSHDAPQEQSGRGRRSP